MPCPECGAEDRLITKDGHTYRKEVVGPGNTTGAKIRAYRCTKCGLRTRGSRFGLPEFDTEEQTEGEKHE